VTVIRCVQPELLDALPTDDARAVRSRRDLRRVNAWMGNARIMARELQAAFARHLFFQVADLGSGDGRFLLQMAHHLRRQWRRLEAVLVDRQNLLAPETLARFERLNWRVQSATEDVLHWLRAANGECAQAVLANLFLHHLHDDQLRELFRQIAAKGRVFIAVEPRRSGRTLFSSRLLWLIGCNTVTRHDAVLSVQAGFTGRELSALWPASSDWELTERPAGLFSHLFVARRKD
jgi:hypothetical protein